MDSIELAESIYIILDKEERQTSCVRKLCDRHYATTVMVTRPGMSEYPVQHFHYSDDAHLPIVVFPSSYAELSLKFENLGLLKNLYLSIQGDTSLEREFISILQIAAARKYRDYGLIGYLIFETLIRLNKFDEALFSFELSTSRNYQVRCLWDLIELFRFEHHLFDEEVLKRIESVVKRSASGFNEASFISF